MPLGKPYRGAQLNISHPLARGLVGCFLLNEGSGVKIGDSSGNRLSGTVTNAIWQGGKSGNALKFDGSGDYVQVANNTLLNPASLTIVYSCFVSDTTSRMGIVKPYTAWSAPYYQYSTYFTSGSALQVAVAINGSFNSVMGGTLLVNTWQQHALTWDGTNLRGYINDRQVCVKSDVSGTMNSYSTDLYLGRHPNNTSYDFSGQIEYCYIYNRALSAREIAWLYRTPFAMFERPAAGPLVSISGALQNLAGASTAQSSAVAYGRASREISGASQALSTSTGLLSPVRKLAAACVGASQLSGFSKSARRIQGPVGGLATVNGSLGIAGWIEVVGTVQASTALSGSITLAGYELWQGGLLLSEYGWLREALFAGMTANAFWLGTVLTNGWFWARREGCTVLYGGPSMEGIDFVNILAVSELKAGEISPPNYLKHSGGETYFYAVRRFNGCGYHERTLAGAVKVAIRPDGNLSKPAPNNILAGSAEQITNERIRLVWFYWPLEQGSQPVCFRIYHGDGTRQVDFENPLGSVVYRGRRFYGWESGTLDDGEHLFAIAAEDAEGAEGCPVQLMVGVCGETPAAVGIVGAASV